MPVFFKDKKSCFASGSQGQRKKGNPESVNAYQTVLCSRKLCF